MTKMQKLPTLFISHGGGPWPYIDEMRKVFEKSAQWLSHLPETLGQKPKAILSVSGHWEEEEFTVSTAEHPPMVYDYSGFPEHTYHIKYPAPGSPELARRIQTLLDDKGIGSGVDPKRGFDHGTFVPLSLMYPNADLPVVQLSMKKNYSPLEHIKVGEALVPLREEGVLIIGSGLSYHNMGGFGSSGAALVSEKFESWLGSAVEQSDPHARNKLLLKWESAPAAREAHPQEDHLIPLMVVAGAAGDDLGKRVFVDHAMNVSMASYQFG